MSSDSHPKPESSEQPDSKKQKLNDMSAQAGAKYTLYSYWRSGASWRVRIALAYKGIPYHYHPVNLLKSEQQTTEYTKLNPQRKVPLLVIDEKRSISQSLAIIDYLDHAHPDTPQLLPKDPFLRAKAWSLAEGVNADIQPLQNLPTLGRIGKLLGEGAKQEWGVWAITNGLKAFEEYVQETAGKYCVGDNVTIVDCCLVPQLSAARRSERHQNHVFNVDLSAYPTLIRIDNELKTHPAFIAGHANAQPDKPADMGPIE